MTHKLHHMLYDLTKKQRTYGITWHTHCHQIEIVVLLGDTYRENDLPVVTPEDIHALSYIVQ